MDFYIFNSSGKKVKLKIIDVEVALVDCARVTAEYCGMTTKSLISFGGGHKKPFLRFDYDEGHIDAVFTNEVIEYIWDKINCPTTGLLYTYTENYRANWCD